MRKTKESTTELEERLDVVENILRIMIALGGKELFEKAKQTLKTEDIKMIHDYSEKKPLSKEEQEEYKRIIAENNNNHNE